MKVLVLGGTGLFGKTTAGLLARENLVAEIAIASRHLEVAQQTAAEIGEKARAVVVDIRNRRRLTSIVSNYDLVVNTAGPTFEVLIPALSAAIEAGTHYCDLGVDGNTAEKALELHTWAQERAVTAIIGIGLDPGLSNLLAVHAAHQLDETDELHICMLDHITTMGPFEPEPSLARARELGRVDTSYLDILEIARGPVLAYSDGGRVRIEPVENPIEVTLPSGHKVTAYPVGTSEPVTLPRYLRSVKTVYSLFSLFPPQLNELYLLQGRRMANGQTDTSGATWTFLETIVADSERWLSGPSGFPPGWTLWVTAIGWKGGRRVRYMCWPDTLPANTTLPLVASALRTLRGQVGQFGVLPPEACFEPQTFFAELVSLRPPASKGPLLGESYEYLS